MKASFFLVIICFYSLATLNKSGAKQADQLRNLIKSQRSSKSQRLYDQWRELDSNMELSFSVHRSSQKGKKEADKITELPGQPKGANFSHYAGYVTVDPKAGRALFYYFVESSHDPSSKPLLLWLNGGPGCSSLGFGAMEEIGPFRVNSDGKTLHRNDFAWNNVANVIFLESPAGVGFSYSNRSTDYDESGDKRTARDSYTFLINWLNRFPEYKNRDFFISGESYAGHYVPQLTQIIIQMNHKTNGAFINLKGVAIGNPYLDARTNHLGQYEFLWNHAMISDEAIAAIRRSCNSSSPDRDRECMDASVAADEESGDINAYNVYVPLCRASQNSSAWHGGISMAEFDPCSDEYVHNYLNNLEVRKALHVITQTKKWYSCRDDLSWVWRDAPDNMLPFIKEIMKAGINLWLFSGDIDAIVSVTATKYFIDMLGIQLKTPWRPWYLNHEVGGYVVEYKGLTLVTVRAAGHLVPSYQPERALAMISSFLKGKLPPS